MVGILRGEFTKSREPSDHAKEQGSYSLKHLHQYSRGCERKSRETVKESNLSIRRRKHVVRSPVSKIWTSEVRKRNPSTSRVVKS
jgi:hypothetical protein